jgi:candidapepsin
LVQFGVFVFFFFEMKLLLLLSIASSFSHVYAGVVQIDFDIYRANSFDSIGDSENNRKGAYLTKRDGVAEMQIMNMQTFYMVEILLGSNQNSQNVLIDTGSSDLWVMSHELTCLSSTRKRDTSFSVFKDKQIVSPNLNNQHQPNHQNLVQNFPRDEFDVSGDDDDDDDVNDVDGKWGIFTTIYATQTSGPGVATGVPASSNTCTQYGSFDTGDSTSFKRNYSTPDFRILYADGTSASGIWGTDTLVFGNTTVDNFSFAVANRTSSDVSVFGIGLPALQVTTQYGITYANLPIKLRQDGTIAKAAYSVFLGSSTATSGTILFGGVDHAKYTGDLVTVPIISLTSGPPNRLLAKVNSISLNSSSNSVVVTSNLYSANLDTGSTLSYFPSSLLNSLVSALGGGSGTSQGYTIVKCPTSNQFMSINFSGRVVRVPLSDLVLRYGGTCLLGVIEQSSSSPYILFGDNVLRSMYVVFDLDDLQISIAQASYSKNTNIEAIGKSVPSAVLAASYSNTQISSGATENPRTTLNDSTTYHVPKSFFLSILSIVFGMIII